MPSFDANPGDIAYLDTGANRSNWTNIDNAIDITTASFAQSVATFGTHISAEPVFWTGWTFPEIDPLWDLLSIEMRLDAGYAPSNLTFTGSTLWSNSSGNIFTGSKPVAIALSPSGARVTNVTGPDDWDIPDANFNWASFVDSSFIVQMTAAVVGSSGTGTLRMWGTRLKFLYNDLSSTAALSKTGNGVTRILEKDEGFVSVIQLASGFSSRSSGNLVLSGVPITLYEDASGNRVPAVYDISEGWFDTPTASSDTYVRDGIRYSFLTAGDYNVFRAQIGAEQAMTPSSSTVWRGIPIGVSANGDLMGKKVTGGILDTRQIRFGGVPLTVVKVENDWALAIGSV